MLQAFATHRHSVLDFGTVVRHTDYIGIYIYQDWCRGVEPERVLVSVT